MAIRDRVNTRIIYFVSDYGALELVGLSLGWGFALAFIFGLLLLVEVPALTVSAMCIVLHGDGRGVLV